MLSLAACHTEEAPVDHKVVSGNERTGKAIVTAVDCGVCHVIPGIDGAHGIVGPSLAKFARRQFVGGIVPNDPAVLARWIKDAPSITANSRLPGTGSWCSPSSERAS
jgi:cytochrome c551/c552